MSHNRHVSVFAIRMRPPGRNGRMRYVTFKRQEAEQDYASVHLGPGWTKTLLVNGVPVRSETGKPCLSNQSA